MSGRTRMILVMLAVLAGVVAGVRANKSGPEPTQQETFIADLVDAAQDNQRATGIPASVAIGMAALETGWGRSEMSQPPINSYFSIKCGSDTPWATGCTDVPSYEYDDEGNKWMEVSSFRTYDSVGDSLLDFGHLLTTAGRYSPAFAHTDDPDEFVRAVRAAGYATDPKYAETVIGIMERHGLHALDLGPGE